MTIVRIKADGGWLTVCCADA